VVDISETGRHLAQIGYASQAHPRQRRPHTPRPPHAAADGGGPRAGPTPPGGDARGCARPPPRAARTAGGGGAPARGRLQTAPTDGLLFGCCPTAILFGVLLGCRLQRRAGAPPPPPPATRGVHKVRIGRRSAVRSFVRSDGGFRISVRAVRGVRLEGLLSHIETEGPDNRTSED